jgi:hypothetical protein
MTGGPSADAGYRAPVMALAAQTAFDSAPCQAWGTVHKWRSQRRLIMVLASQASADGVADRRLGHRCLFYLIGASLSIIS